MYPAQDINEEENWTIEMYCFPMSSQTMVTYNAVNCVAETLNMKLQYRSHYCCNEKTALCD